MQDKKENKNSTLQNEEDFSDLTKDNQEEQNHYWGLSHIELPFEFDSRPKRTSHKKIYRSL